MDAAGANLADQLLATAMSTKLILAQLVSRHVALASSVGSSSATNELSLLSLASREPIAALMANGDDAERKLRESVLRSIDEFFAVLGPAIQLLDQSKTATPSTSAH